jgi:hypothetical protein
MDLATTPPPAYNKRPTKRKIKAFPSELANVTDEDRSRFGLALELDPNPKSKHYGSECLVALTVRVKNVENEDVTVDLKTLVVDHLRQLCRNVGVMNCGSANKFDCRKGLATFFSYQDELDRKGISTTSTAARLTSTLCRMVNVVFSEHFVKDFFSVNDKHSRRDHETKKTYKSFWINATLAHNSCLDSELDVVNIPNAGSAATATEDNATTSTNDNPTNYCDNKDSDNESAKDDPDRNNCGDCFSLILNDDDDLHIHSLLETDRFINLMEVNQFDTKAFRKKIYDLFKIRRIMQENMTVSGTHDNESWNFVESAMATSGLGGGFTKIAVYYFYKQCEACDGIDAVFQPFLDPAMLGDTTCLDDYSVDSYDEPEEDVLHDGGGSISTTSSGFSSRKKKAHRVKVEKDDTSASFNDKYSTLVDQGQMTLKHMEESADREKARFKLEQESAIREKARFELDLNKNKFFARLEVAKAMNDSEELAKLKKEASEMPSGTL